MQDRNGIGDVRTKAVERRVEILDVRRGGEGLLARSGPALRCTATRRVIRAVANSRTRNSATRSPQRLIFSAYLGTDAAFGGADLLGAERGFLGDIDRHVVGHDDMGAVRHQQLGRRDVNA